MCIIVAKCGKRLTNSRIQHGAFDERPLGRHELLRPRFTVSHRLSYRCPMDTHQDNTFSDRQLRRLIWRASLGLILAFWTMQFALLSIYRLTEPSSDGLSSLAPRFVVTLFGIGVSLAIVAIQSRLIHQTFVRRVVATVLLALAGCSLHSLINHLIFYAFGLLKTPPNATLVEVVFSLASWFWYYVSLSAIILALSFSIGQRAQERQLAELRMVAHAAQIRALRYQINPHFLFNTLNSIAALIARKQNIKAELMVENLSEFLRAGLALDPYDDITLTQEIELQSHYLAIENVRFPERLAIHISIPPELREARLPSMLIQPLVENAIKYAVARSSKLVTISITAKRRNDWLDLSVVDSGGDGPIVGQGHGIGISNIEARLRGRYGEKFEFSAKPVDGGGFAAHLSIPLILKN